MCKRKTKMNEQGLKGEQVYFIGAVHARRGRVKSG